MVEQLRFRDPLVDTFYGTMKEFLGIQEIRVKADFFAGKFQNLKESYHFPAGRVEPGGNFIPPILEITLGNV